ncbi:MAG TPA: redoxin domain-containing protein [Anaerolineales bacterium]|nr:redoxin domain-containing protein [Anaerolineales bacterium]
MQCRSHAAQLGRLYNDFKAANVEILLILGDMLEKAQKYAESLHLPFPVLADPTRSVYHQYGLEKSFFLQRTASLVIGCDGKIIYKKSVTNPLPWLQESHQVLEFVKSIKDS